eukprot:361557-Chlamydomonas_euryale.AAC.1
MGMCLPAASALQALARCIKQHKPMAVGTYGATCMGMCLPGGAAEPALAALINETQDSRRSPCIHVQHKWGELCRATCDVLECHIGLECNDPRV